MIVSDHARLQGLAARMKWFHDNKLDIKPQRVSVYLLEMASVLNNMEKTQCCTDDDLGILDSALRKAEEICLPEDAHLYTYDPNWSLWG